MDYSRRQFGFGALTGLAFTGLARRVEAAETYRNEVAAYGALAPDPARLLDLPKGFSYQIVSRAGADGSSCSAATVESAARL